MHRIVCNASNKLKRHRNPGGLESDMCYPQYDPDEELEKLGVPLPISPGTDQFGRIEKRVLITRNIPI